MADTPYQLVVQKGPRVGQIYPLRSENVTIGRDPMADIVINDPEVSRQHVRLTRTQSGYQLQDLGSTNGTFIDGKRLILDSVDLIPGQLITMGSGVVLLYSVESDEDDLSPRETIAHPPPARSGRPPVPEAIDYESDQFQDYDYDERPRRYEPEVRYPGSAAPAGHRPVTYPVPDAERAQRRRNTIIAAVILIILCCCCAFPLSAWFVWGDPLLEWLRALGFFG